VDGLRILLLALVIGSMMGGGLYAGVKSERERSAVAHRESRPAHAVRAPAPVEPESTTELPEPEPAFDPVLSLGFDLDEPEELHPVDDDIVLASGVRIGPMIQPVDEDIVLAGGARIGPLVFGEEAAAAEPEAAEPEPPVARRRTRRAPAHPPGPRLHPDPGVHSILTARRMMANGERILGSCYKYLSEVYERAGHRSWRKRRIVYRAERDGPYADLSQVRPGDWLYIVNDPYRTPVGTHSVMFVRWIDRTNGHASVISHPGWGTPHTGAERTYDISRTYRIIRPTM